MLPSNPDQPRPKKTKSLLTRREFLATAAAAAAVTAIPKELTAFSDAQPTPEIPFSNDRFFENIDDFKLERLPQIEKKLLALQQEHSEAFKKVGVDQAIWEQATKQSVSILYRLTAGYEALKKQGEIKNADDLNFFQRPFRELASAHWALGLTEETYQNNPSGFENIIESIVTSEGAINGTPPGISTGDLFIGNTIFTIDAKWAYQPDHANISPIFELISPSRKKVGTYHEVDGKPTWDLIFGNDPGLTRILNLYIFNMPANIGKEALINYIPSLDEPNRPQESTIQIKKDDLKKKVSNILKKFKLDRVVPQITDVSVETSSKILGQFSNLDRNISLNERDYENQLTTTSAGDHTILHEAGHAAQLSMFMLPDFVDSLRLQLHFDRIFRAVKPYPNINNLWNPVREMPRAVLGPNDFYNHIDRAALGDYCASKYYGLAPIERIEGNVLNKNYYLSLFEISQSVLGKIDSPGGSPQHLIDSGALAAHGNEVFPDFQDFYKNIVLTNPQTSKFTELVTDYISHNAPNLSPDFLRTSYDIDTKDLSVKYLTALEWTNLFQTEVLPFVLLDLINQDSDKFLTTIYDSQSGVTDKMQIRQAVLIFQSFGDHLMARANKELFADLWAISLRSEEPEMKIDPRIKGLITEERILCQSVIETLINNGFAIKTDQNRGNA